MTRQEQSRRRRKRRKMIVLSLLGCLLLFFTGVLITYDVMLVVTGLRRSGSIFSFQSTGQALKDIAGDIPVRQFREAARNFTLQAQRLFDKIRSVIFTVING